MWQQLYMSTTSAETTPGPEHELIIHLKHEDMKRSKRQLHKLAVDVPFYDVKPAAGICVTGIDTVQLDMCIRRRPRRKRRKLEKTVGDSFAIGAPSMHLSAAALPSVDSDSPMSQMTKHGDSFAEPRDLPLDAEECLFEQDQVNEDWDGMEMLFEADAEDDKFESLPSSQTSSLLKRASSEAELDTNAERTSLAAVMMLVDAALRLAISQSPTRLAKGVNVTRYESVRRLADTFPAMWSPGYLPAVSSRAVFIPTISHALNSVCGSTARRRNSERNAQGLANHRLDERRLWQTLQTGLYDSQAARRLQPIRSPEDLPGTGSKSLAVEGDRDDDQGSLMEALDEYNTRVEDDIEESGFEDDDSLLDYDQSDSAYASFCEDDYACNDMKMEEFDLLDLVGTRGQPE